MRRFLLFIFLTSVLFTIQPGIGQTKKIPSGIIQGYVSDNEGTPLPGVGIIVDQNALGQSSDNQGRYSLKLQPDRDYTLRFSFVGFVTKTETIHLKATEGTTLNIAMKPANSSLQQVEIIGRKETGYKTKSTYIGSKSETDIKDLPQSVSYASKELMADQGVMRVGDVVKNFSGVNQFSFYDDITVRGFRVNGQSNTQLINGLRTSTGFWKQPLANYLERVEVLKGPSSALYGNASPGGVVNRVTKKPLDENRKSLSVSMGSFNSFRGLADFTGPATKDSSLLYRLNLGYENAQSFRDLQFNKNLVIAPSLSFLPDDKTRLNFDMVYNDSKGRLDRGQSLFGSNDLNSTPQSISLNTGNDYLNETTYNVSFSLNHNFSDKISFNAAYMKTGYNEDLYEHRTSNAYGVDAAGKTINNMAGMIIQSRKRDRFIDNFSGYFNFLPVTGPIEHLLVAGYDYGSEKLPIGGSQLTAQGYRNATNTGAINTYVAANKASYLLDRNGNPVPNVPHFNLSDILNSQRMADDSKNFFTQSIVAPTFYYLHAGYVQDQMKFGKLQALLGLRYEFYTDFVNYKTATQAKTHSSAWLPRLGLVYSATQNINFYGTYVTGYNPQTAANLSNPNAGGPFDPVKSNMIEFGTKTSWLNNLLGITAAVYQIKQTNTLYPANVAGQPDLLRQVGAERSRGFEMDVTGRITANWSLIMSYAYNQAVITDSPVPAEVGIQKPNAPKNLANFWSRYSIVNGRLKGLGIGAGTNYVAKRNLLLDGSLTIPEYMLLNAALYYNVGKVQLQLNANNITGKKHWVGGYDYLRLFPGAPANYLLTLSYTIN